MTSPHAELKRLAESARDAKGDNARWEALDALEAAANPQAILALIEENERQGTAIIELGNALRQSGVEMDAISAAIGTVRYMDPPDGGDVLLSEQVRRMREENKRMRAAIIGLRAAISWLAYPFVDNNTGEAELRSRVGFMMEDAEKHRDVLNTEADHD